MPPVIEIEGKKFEFVVLQRQGETAVYKTDGEYLRIGKPEHVKKDLDLHKKMEAFGFPVAPLVAEGDHDGMYYFIESSLGEKHLGKLFAEDVSERGQISEENFQTFLSITERFALAQLKTATNVQSFEEFAEGFQLSTILAELPHEAERIRRRYASAVERLAVLPFVITHGDFNPNNMYGNGVIDLEDSFYAPFGYDPVTAIVHINYFPDSESYEYFARYRFTEGQVRGYYAALDGIAASSGLPPLSGFAEDFEFARAVWSSVNMKEWPRLQKWRFDRLTSKFLGPPVEMGISTI